MRAIRETAGYFAYDPHCETAYDPLEKESDDTTYEITTTRLPGIIDDIRKKRPRQSRQAPDLMKLRDISLAK